jgi:hypothetical protein
MRKRPGSILVPIGGDIQPGTNCQSRIMEQNMLHDVSTCGDQQKASSWNFGHQRSNWADANMMDERRTLRILSWAMSSVVLSAFVLSALSLPH